MLVSMKAKTIALAIATIALAACGHRAPAPAKRVGGNPTWLDQILNKQVAVQGTPLPSRTTLNFASSNVTAADNVATDSTDITITVADAGGTALPDAGAGGLWYQNDAGRITPLAAPSAGGPFLQTQGATGLPPQWAAPGTDEGITTAPPVAASWTPVNFGGGTAVVNSGTLATPTVYLSDFTSGGADTAHCIFVNRAGTVGTPYTFTARFRALLFPSNNAAAGIAITDGTKIIIFQVLYIDTIHTAQVVQRNSATSFHANAYSKAWNTGINAPYTLRIQVTGGNRLYTMTVDGQNFIPAPALLQEADTTWINNNETQVGACVDPESSTGSGITIESFGNAAP